MTLSPARPDKPAPPREYNSRWPKDSLEAYARYRGPYTVYNATILLQEEPLEIYNGWLVWQPMTDFKERRINAIIMVILDLAARFAHFGQAYPDQVECLLANEDIIKPDICLVSTEKADKGIMSTDKDEQHWVIKGGPEMAVEVRSPSNTRAEEALKRSKYFENGTQIIWDVDPVKHKIWVYRAENPTKSKLYVEGDTIDCEPFLPGWTRPVADFFDLTLTTEQMVGEPAQQWRAESRTEGLEQGRVEGETQALQKVILIQAQSRFGAELPADLEQRLSDYNTEQLLKLATAITTTASFKDWLAAFPA